MTKRRWLTATDPRQMLEFLRGQASDRKFRLFACACCRRIWHLMSDERSRRAVEVGEQFADRQVTQDERGDAAENAHKVDPTERNRAATAAYLAAEIDTASDWKEAEWHIAVLTQRVASEAVRHNPPGSSGAERTAQCNLLRCMFRIPQFQPVAFDPAWLTSDVLALARGIYDDRAFDRMPILADALQDAGCTNDEVLNHCRDTSLTHVRGCWVVDLLLGKA